MYETFKAGWESFYASFHGSDTIVWARVKSFLGMAFLALTQSGVDLSAFLSQKELVVWQIISGWLVMDGTFSEWARKRGATDLDLPQPPDPPEPPQ